MTGVRSKLASGVKILTPGALDAIHEASLRVLADVGVKIEHRFVLETLKKSGAHVDGDIVCFPPTLVEKVIDSAPSEVTLSARDPEQDVQLGVGKVHFTNGFGATWVEDSDTQVVREATLADLADFIRLADALDHVDYCLFAVVPQDIPPELLDLQCTATALQNTSKHIQLSLETSNYIEEIVDIARASVHPGCPLPLSAGGVPNSPLHYIESTVEKFIALAKHEIPCFIVSGAMAGATAPVTLAGALVQQNAEILAGVAIHQVANPGAPVVYGTFTGGFDMRASKLATGGPELMLINCATQQLADRYGIPLGYGTGGMTDSVLSDVQAGLEKGTSVLLPALAGVDVVHDGASGLLGAGMLTSLAQMVIDNELCASVAFTMQGIKVNEETLAEEAISTVGHGGHFLDASHTLQHFRSELYIDSLRSRHTVEQGREKGSIGMLGKADKRAKEILAQHEPIPLPEIGQDKIESVLKAAYEEVSLEQIEGREP